MSCLEEYTREEQQRDFNILLVYIYDDRFLSFFVVRGYGGRQKNSLY